MQITKRFPFKLTLGWEIFIALLLKVALLYLLWWAFFSHAPDKKVIAATVAERLTGGTQDFSLTSRRNNHD